MATPFHVELVTPERVLYSGESDEVSMRTDGGEIAFLAHHEEFIGALDITVVRIHAPSAAGADAEAESSELRAAVHGGFVNVNEDGVAIYAGVAELATEIDVERARAALASAEGRIGQGETPVPSADPSGESDGTHTSGELHGAMLALLAPDSADAAARRARVRLEATGATATT